MKLISGTICRNEVHRYLPEVLDNLEQFVDLMIVLDDFSDDGTWQWLLERRKHHDKLRLLKTGEPTFSKNELTIRKLLWNGIKQHAVEGDSILINDADEVIPPANFGRIRQFIEEVGIISLDFKLYNMWNEREYRTDRGWSPNNSKRRLFKYLEVPWEPIFNRDFACGEVPRYVMEKPFVTSDVRIKHLSYVRDEDKIKKHAFYIKRDNGKYHSKTHLESIIDKNPTLVEWKD